MRVGIPTAKDLEPVLPWWHDVERHAQKAMLQRKFLSGLRVAIICIDFYRFDSISTSVSEQAIVLMTAGCHVSIVCNNFTGIKSDIIKSRDEFSDSEYDCILYHYYVGDSLLRTITDSKTKKAAFYQGITTPPESYAPYSPDFVETCRDGLSHLSLMSKFDMVFSGSIFNIDQAKHAAAHDKFPPTRMFPPVVAVDRFSGKRSIRKLVPSHILTVSRIYSSKNIEGVIRFAESLANLTKSATRLTIVGAKCEPIYVADLLAKSSNNSLLEIEMCLRTTDDRLKDLYQQADVYACFSHHEGFCIPLVESMSAGIPVVTHNLTAIGQTMAGSGIVVDPFQYEEAASALWKAWSTTTAIDNLVKKQTDAFNRLYDGEIIAGMMIDAIQKLSSSIQDQSTSEETAAT
ncbi:glycosyltransferase family 4 protein [Burkholderia ubonensis]|uniref:glycosyltransferase family 4 protein n=1 Tax=Burkholderia ubonensis TaxID=101571 RepID=UPI000A5F7C86|nr:glycosyltransferase family 4 protein [Burkholderia ubonensis]